MDAIIWLAIANMFIWLGLGLYASFIASKQRNLEIRIKQLENIEDETDK